MYYFILPAYNEVGIKITVQKIILLSEQMEIESKILLIDDGSNPKLENYLGEDLKNFSILSLIRLEVNQGPGKAFATAFEHLPSLLDSQDIVITLEGDGTSPLEILPEMIMRLKGLPSWYDIVLASPYTYGGSITDATTSRKILSYAANGIFRNLLGLRGIWTISSFYRVYSHVAINELRSCFGTGIINSDGFECMAELLWKSKEIGLRISEVPSILDNESRVGRSKMKIFRTIIGYFRLLVIIKKKFRKQNHKNVLL